MTPEKKIFLYQITCGFLSFVLLASAVMFIWGQSESVSVNVLEDDVQTITETEGAEIVSSDSVINNSINFANDAGTSTVTDSSQIVREIIPGGYVINNSMFYSPELNLTFTGRLNDLTYRDGYFFEETPEAKMNMVRVKEEDIEAWDFIKVFPSVRIIPDSADSPSQAISMVRDVLIAEGKNPDQCLINKYSSAEVEDLPYQNFSEWIFYVHNKDTYKVKYPDDELYKILTQEEVYKTLKVNLPPEQTEMFKVYSDYKNYCEGIGNIECMWDYDIALGLYDAEKCSKYAMNSLGGSFHFQNGYKYNERNVKDPMSYFYVRHIQTRDMSPWLYSAKADINYIGY